MLPMSSQALTTFCLGQDLRVIPSWRGRPVDEGSDKEVLESQYPHMSSESASESDAESSSGSESPPDKRPRVRALMVPEPQANWRARLNLENPTASFGRKKNNQDFKKQPIARRNNQVRVGRLFGLLGRFFAPPIMPGRFLTLLHPCWRYCSATKRMLSDRTHAQQCELKTSAHVPYMHMFNQSLDTCILRKP